MSSPRDTPELRIFRAEMEDEELVVTPIDGPPVRVHLLRVLACVNACAGLSTKALETGLLADLVLHGLDWLGEYEGPERRAEVVAKLEGR